jgi:hypothetical protein
LVSEDHAIFVAPTGADGASGTKNEPLKSITEAASVANAAGKIVLVCAGTYDEHVMISAGAKVFGGFDCGTWAYDSASKPSVAPTTTGYALEISSDSDTVVIEDIAFNSKAGDVANPSSIAGFVHDSSNVALTRVKLEAGVGENGANGVTADHTFPGQATLNGNDASSGTGGASKPCGCPGGGSSMGGPGGSAGPQAGGDGQPALGGGKGGTVGSCNPNGTGQDGSVGTSPTAGTGAQALGTVASTGFTPASGANGADGSAGQGGGGGASTTTAGGGGGGCGGCGGAGGLAGKGGGASIALLAFNSPVVINDSDLVAGDAGDGGSGAVGQDGQAEFGFAGDGATGACDGGNGGPGGKGAAGGGGAGGVSAGIAYKGDKPSATGGNQQFGEKGNPGLGGSPGTNDGVDGTAGAEVLLP